jgi:hypothetical protein
MPFIVVTKREKRPVFFYFFINPLGVRQSSAAFGNPGIQGASYTILRTGLRTPWTPSEDAIKARCILAEYIA